MRFWFHPLVFYPLALLFTALVIGVSIRPQSWPRTPAPITGAQADGALVLEGAAFSAPEPGDGQNVTVTRDFLGRAQTLRIAQRPNQPPPRADESGVEILLSPEAAALMEQRPVSVEVTYRPLPFNAAAELAVSVQGGGPATWVRLATPPQLARLRFSLPAQNGVTGIGLRAISASADMAYGLEIIRIRVTPQAPATN